MLQQIDSAIAFSVVMLTLSLIITALVQIVLASFDLRGLNLVWALTRLFHEVDPSFQNLVGKKRWYELFRPSMGRRLAQAVSRYKPLVSGIVGRAKAIRPDELMQVLQKLAKHPPENLPVEVHDALLKLLSHKVPVVAGSDSETAAALLQKLGEALDPNLKVQLETRLADAVQHAVGSVSKLEHEVGQWFDTVMDRSSEVFSAHSKVYTFVFAAVLAFGWHIDSGEIYRQISTNADVRDNLNRAADSVVAQGDKLVQSKHVTAAFNHLAESSKQFSAALGDTTGLKCEDDGTAWITANGKKLTGHEAEVKSAIATACSKKKDSPDFAAGFKPMVDRETTLGAAWSKAPPNLERCTQGERWIQSGEASFGGVDAVGVFHPECQKQAQAAIGEAGESIASLRKTLDDSNLAITTAVLHYGGQDHRTGPFRITGYGYWQHLLGTAATMLLLSLGAPFWFNTLRQLSNLKPVVAQKMEAEEQTDTDDEDA